MTRRLSLLLTAFTGATGLVYEVVWQKYLATLLGSHSEATAAVLAIFLAGMSAGYALFGRLSRRLVQRGRADAAASRLLRSYGLVEAGIGVYAFAFPFYFDAVQALSAGLPGAASGIDFAIDVALAALLIGPPTVLMGGTIPMLTQALSRDLEDATRLHAFVYALNTVGATVGALAAGFVLVPWLGLARVMSAMGAINLLAGAVFAGLAGRAGGVTSLVQEQAAPHRAGAAAYAFVALLVGFAMMAIQTILNRLGALSLGASEFTFATVVAANVLCIALGSFAVARLRALPRVLLWNQWLLFASFTALYFALDQAPYWLHILRLAFGNSDADFYGFHLACFGVVLAAVGLPILCSGATLPLLFHHLREQGGDLGALAGRIYSWNTMGSLSGALLGGYALLFWLDLHHVYRFALAALGAAAILISVLAGALGAARAGALALIAAIGLYALPPWSARLLSSGLFRVRKADEHTYDGPRAIEAAGFQGRGGDLIFYDDDPAITAAVIDSSGAERVRSIINNGKNDGSTLVDYPTMALAAIVPALLSERPQRAFVIGFGTGVTVGELTQMSTIESVKVVEISQGVIRAAPLFDFANFDVTRNPKVTVERSDAYRALLRSRERYDVIVSEPSNPWGTGVEMLFSAEFLAAARSRLTPTGIYVQWMHTYEVDAETIALVLRTYAAVFDRIAVWFGNGNDLLLLGFGPEHPGYDLASVQRRASEPGFRAALARSGVDSFEKLLVHELIPLGVVNELGLTGPLQTLHHPRLSHQAGRAFFRGEPGALPFIGFGDPARLADQRSLFRQFVRSLGGLVTDQQRGNAAAEACSYRRELCTALLAGWNRADPRARGLDAVVHMAQRPEMIFHDAPGENPFREVSELLEGEPPPRYVDAERLTALYETYYEPHAGFDPAALLRAWAQCGPPAHSAEECRRGAERARALLEKGTAAARER
ncbi:MAG TPA: fused MFS/spermidine synthase [Myxococcota bacterium]|nr:fused MFS/spermidine synthase [Myxococcota bacterium]